MSVLKRNAFVIAILVVLLIVVPVFFYNRFVATPTLPDTIDAPSAIEQAVIIIPLAGPVAKTEAEISGMAWYGDYLILLPQYPNRFGSSDGAFFAIAKSDLVAFIDGKSKEPIKPREIPLKAPGLAQRIAGFEGYEAIGFVRDQVFLTIESKPGAMLGNIVKGKIAPDLSTIEIDSATLLTIPPQAGITNLSDETIVVAGNKILTMYEANGANVNAKPVAHVFDLKPVSLGTIPSPNIEYRITDATPTDSTNRFWAINYFYPGDSKLKPIMDPLTLRYGKGKTHAQFPQVERLVEFQISDAALTLADTPPIQFRLPDNNARNWEALARLDNRGFMIATDSFPQTILGFVPR
ncbi:MAG: hypothetical protein HZB51_15550 [Chloroflexi bacterium]|nr:hypothetical protein [Chloroflexota bacterium]